MKRFAIALCLVTINAAAWAQLPLPVGTVSPDGKTMKVENDLTPMNPSAAKQIEYWDRK